MKTTTAFPIAFLLLVFWAMMEVELAPSTFFELRGAAIPFSSQNTEVNNRTLPSSLSLNRIRTERNKFLHVPTLDWKNWAQNVTNKFIFLHVGKAGGSTVHCVLVNGNDSYWHCEPYKQEVKPLITDHYHLRCHMEYCINYTDHTVFLVSLRNPIRRIVSAYNYEEKFRWIQKTLPHFRRKCFPGNITELFLKGLAPQPSNETSPYCWQLAHKVIRGEEKKYRSHFTFNYQANERHFIPAGKHLLVIRQEHMDDDFANLETLLQTGMIGTANSTKKANATMDHASTTSSIIGPSTTEAAGTIRVANKGVKAVHYDEIPREAYANACRVLCAEIQSYKRFLYRARNLNDAMVVESIRDLQETCPNEGIEIRSDC